MRVKPGLQESILRVIGILCLLYSASVTANNVNQYDTCFYNAGLTFDIDALLLKAVAKKESSLNQNSVNYANDGTEAVGIMQIHTQWFSRVRKEFGASREDLMDNACLNINVGAWILSQNFNSHGVNWNSVGAYMAGFAKKHQRIRDLYSAKVKRYYHEFKLKQVIHP